MQYTSELHLRWIISLVLLSSFQCYQVPIESLNYANETITTLDSKLAFDTRPPTPIESSCLSYYSYLARLGSLFTQCVVSYSRPFRVCENCLRYYMEISDAKQLIKNDIEVYATSLYKKGLKCKNIVEATDKVQTIVKIFNTIDVIWSEANCYDCFATKYNHNGTFNFTIKPKYDKFFKMHNGLEKCIFNYTSNPINMDPLFETYTANSTLCSTCKNEYVDLTKHFKSLGQENDICMDVVDLFNYTRVTWSKGYECNYRDFDELNVVLISSFTILASIVFYFLMPVIAEKEKRYFVKTNRDRSFT